MGVKKWIVPTNSSRMGERKRRQEPESKSLSDNDGRADGRTDGRVQMIGQVGRQKNFDQKNGEKMGKKEHETGDDE